MQDAVDRIIEQWRRERPDVDCTSIGVVGRISRISQVFDRSIAEVMARHDLLPGWFDVLAALRRSGGDCELAPTAMQATMMLTSGAITKRIDRMVEEGLVERRPDPSDGRGVLVRLTAEGRRRVDATLVDHMANETRLVAALEPAERAALEQLLRVLGSSLVDQPGASAADAL